MVIVFSQDNSWMLDTGNTVGGNGCQDTWLDTREWTDVRTYVGYQDEEHTGTYVRGMHLLKLSIHSHQVSVLSPWHTSIVLYIQKQELVSIIKHYVWQIECSIQKIETFICENSICATKVLFVKFAFSYILQIVLVSQIVFPTST